MTLSEASPSMLSGSDLASFPRFGRNGAHLRIRYDLAFSYGADLHSLVLPEKDAEGGASDDAQVSEACSAEKTSDAMPSNTASASDAPSASDDREME